MEKKGNESTEETLERRRKDIARKMEKKANESHEETLERRRKDTAMKKNARTNGNNKYYREKSKTCKEKRRIATYDQILKEKRSFLLE